MRALFAVSLIVLASCSSSERAPDATDTGSMVDASHEVQGIGDDSAADTHVVDMDVPVMEYSPLGWACSADTDCGPAGLGLCSNHAEHVGPFDPTPVCIEGGSSDVCTPTDETTIHFCDGNLGLCTKSGTSPARCEAMCILSADGTWAQKCAGHNGCNVVAYGTDSMTMTISLIGTCRGGCRVDADCPSGSKCDPVERFCAKTCTGDSDCTAGWSAPANFACDTARGACAYVHPKKLGDTCTTQDECPCLGGRCTEQCRAGDDCGSGFVCDPFLPSKDSTGKTLFTLSTLPPELMGVCVRTCSTDGDCGMGQRCDLSAGLAQKTCRPEP